MINIEKDGTKYTVSKDAFEIYFKDIGFEIVTDKKSKAEKVEEPKEEKVEEPKEEKTGKKDLKVGDKK